MSPCRERKFIPWLHLCVNYLDRCSFKTNEEEMAEGKCPHCVVKRRYTTAISVHIAIHIKCAKCELRAE